MSVNLAWSDLSFLQQEEYYSFTNPKESVKYLSRAFNFEETPKNTILLDFYTHNLRFAAENKFSPEQTSTFFSLLKMTHQHCVSTPFILFESDYNYFKELLLKHSIHRPPYSVRIFSLLQIKQISEYVTNTYFRHYLMYKYAFTKKVLMDLTIGTKTDGEQPEEECVIENIEPIIQPPPEDFNEQCEVPAEVVDSTIIEENAFPDSSIPTEEDIIVRISPEVKAKQDLRQFIIANLTSKVEELKLQLQSKISMQDEMLHSQLKKIEDSLKKEEEKIEKGGKKGKEGRKK